MQLIWDLVRDFGAVVGLLTGLFVLAERWTRHYPQALFSPKPLGGFGRQTVMLSVSNRSDRPMLVKFENGSVNGHFRAARDDSSHAIITATLPGETWIPIDAGDTRTFPLLKPPNYEHLGDDSQIALRLWWRFAQPILWRGDRSIQMSIEKSTYQRLIEDRIQEVV